MSTSKGATKFLEEKSSVNLMEKKSKMRIQPHFAKHTESSLRKTKIPIKLNKKLSILEATKLKKLQENLAFSRLNGISKKRNKIVRQSQSMKALKTILKQEKQRRMSDVLQDNKITETVCQSKQYTENLLVSLQGDLIKYVSLDPKKCAKSLSKSQALQDEMSSLRSSSVYPQDDSKSISNCSKNCTILNISYKLQSQLNGDEENSANSYCKIEVLHQSPSSRFEKPTENPTEKSTEPTESTESTEFTESIEPTEPTESMESTESTEPTESMESTESTEPTEDCSKIEEQMFQQNVSMNLNAATNCRRAQETLTNEKIEVQSEPNLQLTRNSKFIKLIDYSRNEDIRSVINNDDVMFSRKKGVLQKNFAFVKAQQAWRPPSAINSSHIESMYVTSSMQPMLRKPYRSTGKYVSPMKNKYASIEYAEKLKQQQILQSTEEVPRRKKSANKVDSKVSKKYNDGNPKKSKSESESRYWQTRLITRTRSSKTRNDIEQHQPDSSQIRRMKPLEVIPALKGNIKNIKEHVDENAVSSMVGMLNHEEIKFSTLPNKKPFSKIIRKINPRFTKNKNLNEANQSVNKSYKSVSTQVELNSFLHLKIDSKNSLDSKKIFKSTQTIATQTSSCRNKSVVDVRCNTTVCDVTYKNVGVFCDLIDLTNMEVKTDSTAIQNKSVSEDIPIQTNESLFTESVEINAENKCPNDSEKTLTTEMSLKLEDYVGVENDAQCEDVLVSELEENIASQMIAPFEFTAERARNLYKAIIIYQSLMSRKFERRQEKYALEVWDESFEMNRRGKALALPMATKKISIVSRETTFVYYVLCILLVWCLQLLFKCDSVM
ncbi:putative leucine-rich repeat-containing protein DDB_G0290503 isoform X2 [Linepithema humile]|uniref:putative leucine-rich repeat-containing protein DDB_G0290503 isoform X2 n=1 Tax=Linepithema humile TaxID=83485 RepID=UPI0006235966|nr:PREDICTED: uncharacterized protein LOC105670655 isoform X2 [Linepithema humile]